MPRAWWQRRVGPRAKERPLAQCHQRVPLPEGQGQFMRQGVPGQRLTLDRSWPRTETGSVRGSQIWGNMCIDKRLQQKDTCLPQQQKEQNSIFIHLNEQVKDHRLQCLTDSQCSGGLQCGLLCCSPSADQAFYFNVAFVALLVYVNPVNLTGNKEEWGNKGSKTICV